jgi:ferrous iron transport protein A
LDKVLQKKMHPSTIPLSLVSSGMTAKILEVRGGRKLKNRLLHLGLNIGSEIHVIKNDVSGPLILAVKEDSRLALGRGMAHQIQVDISNVLN